MKPKILLVEDDPSIAKALFEKLTKEGYELLEARNGRKGLELALHQKPHLILLDLMLPEVDGLEICRQVRKESEVPIIMITAKGDETDIVVGFELGADDYITKPFSLREVLARVKAVLKRSPKKEVMEKKEGKEILIEGGVIDLAKLEVRKGKKIHPLSSLELEVLNMLVQNQGEPVSRYRFLNEIWGYEVYPTTRTIDFHVSRLRSKIEKDPAEPRHILTVHGVGYKFIGCKK